MASEMLLGDICFYTIFKIQLAYVPTTLNITRCIHLGLNILQPQLDMYNFTCWRRSKKYPCLRTISQDTPQQASLATCYPPNYHHRNLAFLPVVTLPSIVVSKKVASKVNRPCRPTTHPGLFLLHRPEVAFLFYVHYK